jgi:hypothetical protein
MNKNTFYLWLCAVVTALIVATLSVLFYPVENPDCSARYAPMAEAFARGDWYEAFHPRFCVLFQILTGSLVWLLGCSGVTACQIVSAVFLGFAVVPYWHIMRRIFKDDRVAWIALGIMLVIPRVSGDAMNGLRDTGRILAIAMWILGFLNMLDLKRGVLLQTLGVFIMVTLKIDCFVPAAVMSLLSVAFAFRRRLWNGVISIPVAFVLATLAVCTMVWSYTGWFVPAPQYISFLKGLL